MEKRKARNARVRTAKKAKTERDYSARAQQPLLGMQKSVRKNHWRRERYVHVDTFPVTTAEVLTLFRRLNLLNEGTAIGLGRLPDARTA